MKTHSLRTRIVLLMAGGLLVSNLVTILVLVSTFRSQGRKMVDAYRIEAVENVRRQIEQQVEIAHGILSQYQDSADDPASRARQQAAAKRALDGIRFGGAGYFFAYQYDGVARVLPTKPEWVGQNKLDAVDDAGNPLVRNLIEVARCGGDTTRYVFDKPGTGRREPKLGYAKGFDKWEWMIGEGYASTTSTPWSPRGAAR